MLGSVALRDWLRLVPQSLKFIDHNRIPQESASYIFLFFFFFKIFFSGKMRVASFSRVKTLRGEGRVVAGGAKGCVICALLPLSSSPSSFSFSSSLSPIFLVPQILGSFRALEHFQELPFFFSSIFSLVSFFFLFFIVFVCFEEEKH